MGILFDKMTTTKCKQVVIKIKNVIKISLKWQVTDNLGRFSRKGFHTDFVHTLRPEIKAECHYFKAKFQVQTYFLEQSFPEPVGLDFPASPELYLLALDFKWVKHLGKHFTNSSIPQPLIQTFKSVPPYLNTPTPNF